MTALSVFFTCLPEATGVSTVGTAGAPAKATASSSMTTSSSATSSMKASSTVSWVTAVSSTEALSDRAELSCAPVLPQPASSSSAIRPGRIRFPYRNIGITPYNAAFPQISCFHYSIFLENGKMNGEFFSFLFFFCNFTHLPLQPEGICGIVFCTKLLIFLGSGKLLHMKIKAGEVFLCKGW